MTEVTLIAVAKGDDYLEVHPTTLAAHKARGWRECAKRDAPAEAPKAPADMTAAELKGELEAYRVDFKGNASKADLVELVTAARAKAAGGQS